MTKFISVGVGPIPHCEKTMKAGKPKEGLSQDYTYMCKKMNTEMAALPISTKKEYKLFNDWMCTTSSKNRELSFKDYLQMANDFLNKENGKTIFPKTVPMLKKY